MLKRIRVILYVVIIIIGICEKVSSESIDIGCGHIWRRKSEPLWMLHLIHLLRIIIKSFAKFITQIGVRILITDYLDRRINPPGAVVGGKNDFITFVGNLADRFAR